MSFIAKLEPHRPDSFVLASALPAAKTSEVLLVPDELFFNRIQASATPPVEL
ncbi:hypothetical protein [Paenibacillus sp. FJAT-26967]|uniref:hypothetical protein n=1 Tax=Paenibacillus sp. FJAT-26967 TaxID=1729690 RepID=UPI000ADB05A5|nr:hypothetical protein [Paenibacillus sp. FJAT-26967]